MKIGKIKFPNFWLDDIEEGGKNLHEKDFFRDFISLMHNIEFDNFYKKYFQNWSDIETMIFYMK